MELLSRPALFDRSLARLATGCLGGSFVAVCGFLIFTVTAAAQPGWLFARPATSFATLVGAIAFLISAYVLAQLGSRSVVNPRLFWGISLGSNAIIVVLVAAALGVQLGLVICIPELLGISVHLVAIARQRSSPLSGRGDR
jgi:hypothetical protein